MTRKALLDSPPTTPLAKRRKGEVAGGAAAECAAVCCCCPCSMMNLLILAVYKVPKGICKRAWAKTKKTPSSKKGLLPKPVGLGDGDLNRKTTLTKIGEDEDEDHAAFEKEMWDRFHGHGFWRTESSPPPDKES